MVPMPGVEVGEVPEPIVQEEEEAGEGGRVDLRPFTDAVIPGPSQGPYPEDAEGWSQIDGWGAYECAVSSIMPMEEVPGPFRSSWASALATVLRRVNIALAAGDQTELDRSMKWLLALPKLLLRQPRRGGERGQGSGEVAARFQAVQQSSWGSLLPPLQRDEVAEKKRRDRKKQQVGREEIDPAQEEARLRKTVLSLVRRGQVGRARRRVASYGIADMANPTVREAVKEKYPPRSHPMPETVLAGTCLERVPSLRDTLLNLQPGVSSGFGALRHEHLRAAAQNWEEGEEGELEQFALAYLNGKLPPWIYKVWGSVSSVPLFKTVEQVPSEIRPVGIKASLIRVLHRRVVQANKGALREYLEPCQVALMPGGAAVLSHTVRMMLEQNPTFVCVSLDVKNAHNAMARSAVVKRLEAVPGLRHLAQHAATCLAAHHAVESGGERITCSGQGLCQGDSEASGCYCVGWHPEVLALNNALQLSGGLAIFGNDDGYAIGPAEVVFPAVVYFREAIRESCGLTLRLSKCLVYTLTGELPPQAPAGMKRAGIEVEGGRFLPGFRCYGVFIGSDAYVRHMLKGEGERICSEIDKMMHLLREDSQAAWVIVSTAMAHQLDYSLTLQYPSDVLECAEMVDARLWAALGQLAGHPQIPRRDEGGGVECVLDFTRVPSLLGRSYQHLLAAQPVKLGGLGLRSLVETRHPAFLGGLEQALPFMVAGELCELPLAPSLQAVIGNMAGGQGRWAGLAAAGSRTGIEFQESWGDLTGEARSIWDYLGEEPTGTLADPLEEMGRDSVDGSTRTKAVQQREGLRHQLLLRALAAHPDQDSRPVTAYQNVSDDKCAGSWTLAIPSRDNCLSSPVFKEALSAHLCLPSPALRQGGWVGKPVGTRGEVIDKFGDAVLCSHEIPGDSWRHRHDTVKMAIYQEACLSKVPVDCEVYGLFSDLLPAALQEDGAELQWGRARQGKVPDFKFLLSTPEGPRPSLAELKVISAGKTWYPRGVKGKGTCRRAARLTNEYEMKLHNYDVRFHGAAQRRGGELEPPPGPLVARFRHLGGLEDGQLVAGPWGDLSPDLHKLLLRFAESRVAAMSRAQGWEAGPGQLGKVMGEIRRALSVTVVRANAICLLERLSQLGPGARAAAKRRQGALLLEERRRQEREAFEMARQARGSCRVGRAFVP